MGVTKTGIMMKYSVGGKIISKKNHACGGNEWQVVRTGADIKLKCNKCGRTMFLSVDETDKITKSYIPAEEKEIDV